MISDMARASVFSQMVRFTKENGVMANLKELGFFLATPTRSLSVALMVLKFLMDRPKYFWETASTMKGR